VRIAVVADVHLDTKFAGLPAKAAALRRENLKKALERAVEFADGEKADALLVGGDLYEQERFAVDTGRFLSRVFESFSPRPVLVVPGNHDWWGSESLYSLTRWSSNVHIFVNSDLEPFELEDGITVWGAAHQASRTEVNFLDGFRSPGGGVHVGLIHGSETSRFSAEMLADPDKFAHAPFTEADIDSAGLAHLFAGHYHNASSSRLCTYPGNLEPLSFGEDRVGNPRGVVLATIKASGDIEVEPPRDVSVSNVHSIDVDVSGASDKTALVSQAVSQIYETVEGQIEGSFIKVSLTGEVAPDIDLEYIESLISGELEGAAAVIAESGRIRRGIDYEEFADEQSIKGEFVRETLSCSDLDAELKQKVIATGLAALDGRDDLLSGTSGPISIGRSK
jgi:exonuclease SbcD